jgi:assimilatory nitrate reductase catalytic subunit
MSRTGNVARLFAHAEEPLLAMNRADMQRRGLQDGDIVRVTSRRGALGVRVRGSDELRVAQTYLPMHWGGRFMHGGGINSVMPAAFDPVSRQPELKHAAVEVKKLDYRWQVVAMRSGDASRYLDAVRPLLERFPYASCGLAGRDVPLLVFRAAADVPASEDLIADLDALLELDDDTCAMDYRDPRRGISKRVLVQDGKLVGARLTGETAACDWLKELMAKNASAEAVRRWMLAPWASPPAGQPLRGRVVCNCFDIAESEIRRRLADGATLEQVQTELKCGTSCGSCLPELRRMAQLARAAA